MTADSDTTKFEMPEPQQEHAEPVAPESEPLFDPVKLQEMLQQQTEAANKQLSFVAESATKSLERLGSKDYVSEVQGLKDDFARQTQDLLEQQSTTPLGTTNLIEPDQMHTLKIPESSQTDVPQFRQTQLENKVVSPEEVQEGYRWWLDKFSAMNSQEIKEFLYKRVQNNKTFNRAVERLVTEYRRQLGESGDIANQTEQTLVKQKLRRVVDALELFLEQNLKTDGALGELPLTKEEQPPRVTKQRTKRMPSDTSSFPGISKSFDAAQYIEEESKKQIPQTEYIGPKFDELDELPEQYESKFPKTKKAYEVTKKYMDETGLPALKSFVEGFGQLSLSLVRKIDSVDTFFDLKAIRWHEVIADASAFQINRIKSKLQRLAYKKKTTKNPDKAAKYQEKIVSLNEALSTYDARLKYHTNRINTIIEQAQPKFEKYLAVLIGKVAGLKEQNGLVDGQLVELEAQRKLLEGKKGFFSERRRNKLAKNIEKFKSEQAANKAQEVAFDEKIKKYSKILNQLKVRKRSAA